LTLYEGGLSINNNTLTGSIPAEWETMYIDDLDLSHNQLSGPLPTWLSNHKYLYNIRLRNNKFNGSLPQDWTASKAGVVDIACNQLSGPLPASWAISTPFELEELDLSNNMLTGTLPIWTNSSGQAAFPVKSLVLTNNSLNGTLPPQLPAYIRVLQLEGNNFTGPLPATWKFEEFKGLRDLRLANNNLSGSIPPSWDNFTLYNFTIMGNDISPTNVRGVCITSCYSTKSECYCTGTCPVAFGTNGTYPPVETWPDYETDSGSIFAYNRNYNFTPRACSGTPSLAYLTSTAVLGALFIVTLLF
jgi:hypothetical protein